MSRIFVNGSGTDPALDVEIGAAVHAAGGAPFRLSFDAPVSLEGADALLLIGGEDIEPSRFGAARHPTHVPLEPGREAFDFELLSMAFEAKLPLLAVCLGAQELWVRCGGRLIQDIPSESESKVDHRAKERGNRVHLLPGSFMARCFGRTEISVYCNHHQGFCEEPAPRDLVVTARSDDGLVEGFEGTDPDHFVVAAGWHPERAPLGNELFEALVSAARRPRDVGSTL